MGCQHRALLTVILIAILGTTRLPAVVAQEYTIGARDILKITVWGHDDLSKDYPVDPDGLVPFPLIGRIQASGLTTKEFAKRLTVALERDYLVNPQVLVAVKEYLSQKVHVLGEAEKPGLFYMTGPTSLLEILSKAGGLSKTAGKHLVLVRVVKSAPGAAATKGNTILRLDFTTIQDGDTKDNIALEDEDTIFVPKAQAFFVLGEVGRAGTFALDKETTVLEAITLAGGFNDKASPSGVKIIRRTATGGQDTLSLDLSGAGKDRAFPLQDGDTIVVPKGNTYFVFGQVRKPGSYFLDKGTNILEAVTVAGGFTDFAAPNRTRVIRQTAAGGQQVINVSLGDIIRHGQRDKAIELKENDVVVVP